MTASETEHSAPSPPVRPGTAGAAASLDPRRNAYRPDIAAQSLYGRVNAPRYASGIVRQVQRPTVPLRRVPQASAGFETEALLGEHVTVYDEADGWAWIQLARDRYVGYVPADTLTPDVREPTHRVSALGTFVYPVADIKAPPLQLLSLNAAVTVASGDERFSRLDTGGFIVTRHLSDIGRHEPDFVEIAERFVGTPYLWGGRTRLGLDCSGLVQVAMIAAGIDAPRDSDMQQAEIGSNVLVPESLDGLARGDLVFWKGHVGIMVDSIMLVHANAHHMAVVVETLPEAAARIARAGAQIAAVKRPARLGA